MVINKNKHCNFYYVLLLIAGFTNYHNADLQELQDALMMADEQDLNLVHVKLLLLNRRIENVAGDGNCLFHAVAHQLSTHPTRPYPCSHQLL